MQNLLKARGISVRNTYAGPFHDACFLDDSNMVPVKVMYVRFECDDCVLFKFQLAKYLKSFLLLYITYD